MKKPQLKYEKNHGGREKYFRVDRKLDNIGDCVIRACAIATSMDYMDTMKRLFEIGLEFGLLPNDNKCFDIFLLENGFKKEKPYRNNKKKLVMLRNFPADESKVYVISVRTHLVAVVENTLKDTWFSGEYVAYSYYIK